MASERTVLFIVMFNRGLMSVQQNLANVDHFTLDVEPYVSNVNGLELVL